MKRLAAQETFSDGSRARERFATARRWAELAFAGTAGAVWGGVAARTLLRLLPPGIPGLWIYDPLCTALTVVCCAFVALLLATHGRRRHEWASAREFWPLFAGVPLLFWQTLDPVWGIGALLTGAWGLAQLRVRRASSREARGAWAWDVLALLAPLGLYMYTLTPSVLPGDSGEFQIAPAVLGIPHPTGYPLYLLLGRLVVLFPIGSVAYRLNLLSAVAGAGAVWATFRAARALGLRRPAAAFSAGLLMVLHTLWGQAIIAEKYALNAFFCAFTLWLGLRWRQARRAQAGGRGWLLTWAAAYGLSLAHHRTMLLLAPAYLWLVWSTDRSALRLPAIWAPVACILAPLSLYLLLPLFSALDPPYAYTRVDSVGALLDLVLARDYQGLLFRGSWGALPARLSELGRALVREFGPAGLVTGVVGWLICLRRDRRVALSLAAGMLAEAAFALNYYVPNASVYYLSAYVWLAVCSGYAVDWTRNAIERRVRGWRVGSAHVALAWEMAALALPIGLCAARWEAMDGRRAYAAAAFDHTYAQVAAHSVRDDALVVSDWLPATVLWYAQQIEGRMPDAQVTVADPLEQLWMAPTTDGLAVGRSVYLARPIVGVSERHPIASAGPLVRVLSMPDDRLPPTAHRLGIDLEGGLRLLGREAWMTLPGPEGKLVKRLPRLPDAVPGGSTLHVTLYWQPTRTPKGDYAVTVRVVDSEGQAWVERQNRHPVGGTYPTRQWQPGQVVADYYRLALPPYLPSGTYRVYVSIGEPFGDVGLRAASGSDRLGVLDVAVQKPLRWARPVMGTALRKRMGPGLVLVGYDAPRQVVPGQAVTIDVWWLIRGRLEGKPALEIGLEDGDRIDVTARYRPADWVPGALVVDRYTFTVPKDLVRVQVHGGGSERKPVFRLPVRRTDAPPPMARLGGGIRLWGYRYERSPLRPGDTLRLTLEWEAAQPVQETYKVFVHVLGAHGLPIAQQDNEPVNGTYPTSRWRPGERVSDPYAIRLPSDLAPGEYQVEVGMYRISDLARLPVLGKDGNVVDDKVFLKPVVVRAP